MKILIINPNSDPEMTAAIGRAARNFAAGDFEVDCLATPGAPHFIETYEDELKAGPGMVRLLRDHHDRHDAFIVACHCDPNLDALKEISRKPVVGSGEASMKIASMLGRSFSVLSATRHSIPHKAELVRKYHLEGMLASIRTPGAESDTAADEERYLQAARQAVEEDGAEVIVLGCAGMTGSDKAIQEQLGVPVLDGVVCALIIAFGLVKYGVSTSRAGKYGPEH
ncbi:MAG: aspartate/glutamate racemase family protein [Candidatus Aminicenantales bacterium]